MEENVLAPFLASRQKEVAEIMVTLFDQEKIMEIHDYHVAEDARKDGVQEGIVEGTLGSIRSLMKNLGMTIERRWLQLMCQKRIIYGIYPCFKSNRLVLVESIERAE